MSLFLPWTSTLTLRTLSISIGFRRFWKSTFVDFENQLSRKLPLVFVLWGVDRQFFKRTKIFYIHVSDLVPGKWAPNNRRPSILPYLILVLGIQTWISLIQFAGFQSTRFESTRKVLFVHKNLCLIARIWTLPGWKSSNAINNVCNWFFHSVSSKMVRWTILIEISTDRVLLSKSHWTI